ncbi:DUF433 domain-containing protein [uncultured Imperialibacter sp.]|uniref:DUF433 domain-containing protein n=1 Tax=uncultured Imperialibacter sp. TaxID=1672639 RepID=UPI0030DCCD57|tara:strand:- start:26584 stop:26826 length:243 start_codon:yes stop_codon:yes gene_type:complete
MDNIKSLISIDSDVQNGQPVFAGTRVPVQTLFWHLEKGIALEEFLEDFPSVSKEKAIGVLEIANKIVTSAKLDSIYEAID